MSGSGDINVDNTDKDPPLWSLQAIRPKGNEQVNVQNVGRYAPWGKVKPGNGERGGPWVDEGSLSTGL